MATTQIFMNGKDITKALHKDDLAPFAQALVTKNPDSAAWRNLAANSKVTAILSVADASFEVAIVVDGKPRTNGATIGKINSRLALVASANEWQWDVLTEKGTKVSTEESTTDVDAVLALITA